MASDDRLVSPRFPRSSQYYPDWVLSHASGGANVLWLTEWLTSALDLRPGTMRSFPPQYTKKPLLRGQEQ